MSAASPYSRRASHSNEEMGARRAWVAGQLRRGAPGYHEIVEIIRGAAGSPIPRTGWLQCGRLAVGYAGLLLLFALIPLLLVCGHWLPALAAAAGWIYVLRPLQYAINGELAARILAARVLPAEAGVGAGCDERVVTQPTR